MIKPSLSLRGVLQMIFRLHPFLLSFSLFAGTTLFCQTIGVHINLRRKSENFSQFVPTVIELVAFQPYSRIRDLVNNKALYDQEMFLMTITRLGLFLQFISTTVYLFGKSARISNKIVREPDELDDLDNILKEELEGSSQQRSVKQRIVNLLQSSICKLDGVLDVDNLDLTGRGLISLDLSLGK
jgi:hypothetical protein